MAITKKIRFEIFKRDGFACAYCGKTPPEITLEVDHIEPKSKGGKDDINNLITACFDCNRGKRDIPLDKAPSTLIENLEVLKEKEEQLKEYNKFIKTIEKRTNKETREIEKAFQVYFPDLCFTEQFKKSTIRRFLKHLQMHEIINAVHLAGPRKTDPDACLKYFCGICWNIIKKDDPEKKIVQTWIQLGYHYKGRQIYFNKRDLRFLAQCNEQVLTNCMHEALYYQKSNYWNEFIKLVNENMG